MEIPGINDSEEGIGLYWSESRVYSPDLREWLSVDPMVKMNPQSLVGMPGNWNAVEYAGGDPVNMVDTSGHFAHIAAGAIAAGAIAGGVAGGLISGISSYMMTGKSVEAFKAFGSGFVGGSIAGATIAATGGVGILGGFTLGGVSSMASKVTDLALHGQSLTTGNSMAKIISSGAMGSIGGAILGSWTSRFNMESGIEKFLSHGMGINQEFASSFSDSLIDFTSRSFDRLERFNDRYSLGNDSMTFKSSISNPGY